jgi:hypothetical protein
MRGGSLSGPLAVPRIGKSYLGGGFRSQRVPESEAIADTDGRKMGRQTPDRGRPAKACRPKAPSDPGRSSLVPNQ